MAELRKRIAELEASEAEHEQVDEALRKSEERYQFFYNNVPAMLHSIDRNGRMVSVSDHWLERLGYEHSEVIGRKSTEFLTEDSRRYAEEVTLPEFFKTGFARNIPYQFVKKDGETINVLLSAISERDAKGNIIRSLAVLVDVTERKRAAEALRKSYHELEERVEERTTELKAANEQLEKEIAERKQTERKLVQLERLRAVGEMSAGVSHNLNNILYGVLGPAQLLERETDNPKILHFVRDIITSGKRARDLVQRLYQTVRSAEEGTLQPVSVNEAVQAAVRASRPRWKDEPEARGITIDLVTELEELPAVKGTLSGLHDILVNLIFNAVDAMLEGGTISICTRTVEEDVLLTVRDTGVGMDKETRRRVFEPFFTTKAKVGTGLGLSTIYGMMTRWGGSIEVESAPGRGTTFTVRFLAWTGQEVQSEERGEVHPVRPGRILIVEDEEMVYKMLSKHLLEDHEVETALSGQEALERFAPGRYDVALIDLGMAGMPGDEVARAMRQVDPSVVTVLITAWVLEEDDRRLSPFDFYLYKPFDSLEEVEAVVAQAVELHDARVEGKS